MPFEPIAIVGEGCVLPGALSPTQLWQAVDAGSDLLRHVPAGYWGVAPARVLSSGPDDGRAEAVASDRGGYVHGFDAAFDPHGLEVSANDLLALDPLCQWLVHCARQALAPLGDAAPPSSAGVIVGNLSYPSTSLVALTRAELLPTDDVAATRPSSLNRFMSGYPAHLVANAFGLRGQAFCLDAACASSLYAIRLACDALHDRRADLVLAGGVNAADDLFVHTGFSVLKALSPSGRSRPFHCDADGLVPAQGAALVALKRLADAQADDNEIIAVIRGVGLANDGRGKGFLAPDSGGQVRAMQAAYEMSGLAPQDISLVECHATGTARGDGVELASMRQVFSDASELPIGSLKSNLGHLITASGAAALVKLTAAMRSERRPASLHADAPHPAVAESPFRILHESEAWPDNGGVRRAAINNFGFGGNNAHLIVEQWQPSASTESFSAPRSTDPSPIAVVAVGALTGFANSREAFAQASFADSVTPLGEIDAFTVPLAGLALPPTDLAEALPSHLALLTVVREALSQCAALPAQRTAALVGMQCDTETARYGLRWQCGATGGAALDDLPAPLTPAAVLGCMPNVIANRLNVLFDWRAPSFATSSEELSGCVALQLAIRGLRAGDLDAAVVGAVDLSVEAIHSACASDVLSTGQQQAGDAAVALVLMRLEEAERRGDTILAVIDDGADADDNQTHPCTGHAHAAAGLVDVVTAVLGCATRQHRPASDVLARPQPATKPITHSMQLSSFSGQRSAFTVRSYGEAPTLRLPRSPAAVFIYAAQDAAALRAQLAEAASSSSGAALADFDQSVPARLAIVCEPSALAERLNSARDLLASGASAASDLALAPGIYYRATPMPGELAFAFTGAVAAYSDMGRDLAFAMPDAFAATIDHFACLGDVAQRLYARSRGVAFDPVDQLQACSWLCQFHAELSLRTLGLKPSAALGLSSGETNALFALGAWHDMAEMFAHIDGCGLYGEHLTDSFQVLGGAGDWVNWRVLAPRDVLQRALAEVSGVTLTIVNAPGDCVIGGREADCDRLLKALGPTRAHRLGLDMVVHCAAMAPFADTWRSIHSRDTTPVDGVRFYANATGHAYTPTRERAADALLGQALTCVDFPRTVEQAWRDGVRVFVEHGPRDSVSSAIDATLGDREHLCVALDRADRPGTLQLQHAVAQLIVAGHVPEPHAVMDALVPLGATTSTMAIERPPHLCVRGHAPVPKPSESTAPDTTTTMPKAPRLLPTHEQTRLTTPAPVGPEGSQRASNQWERLQARLTTPSLIAAEAAPTGGESADLAHVLQSVTALHSAYLDVALRGHRAWLQTCSFVPPASPSRSTSQPQPPTPAASSPPPGPPPPTQPSAPHHGPFSRTQLEELSQGRISSVFGPLFKQQDDYAVQVRMPTPPLLLADRVIELHGEPGSMGLGTVVTETDVTDDAWYLCDGVMPPGVVIESGQADLLLISWLGADFHNKGERAYRLLGCELTFHEGGLPRPGQTLRFDIHIDGHARQGDVGLFFFHYDCHVDGRLLLSVRNGQAGFFSPSELAASGGVLWDAADDTPLANPRLATTPSCTQLRSFDSAALDAFAAGDAFACFGQGFEPLACHQRTPRIGTGRMRLLDEITHFEPTGGPWQRGYLCARSALSGDEWFFDGHFHNDPCMPGTLMADAAVQALGFTLAALGFTIGRDGWRFEPVAGCEFKFLCRGQVTPTSRELHYEVFVEEIVDGPCPEIHAALLCSADSLKVFHCRRFGLALVPDYPLQRAADDAQAHYVGGDVRGDYAALLACASGAPSAAFGAMYAPFDGPRTIPRLPAPPYHFISRIASVDGGPGTPTVGAVLVAEYEVPSNVWYFDAHVHPVMPFCVLLEAMLQPCGWFASYCGLAVGLDRDVVFRNLDGDRAVPRLEVHPSAGTLLTRVEVLRCSRLGATSIIGFDVRCELNGAEVLAFETTFGFFGHDALRDQAGLPGPGITDALPLLDVPLAVNAIAARSSHPSLKLPNADLLMVDAVTGYWPEAGAAGLGAIRGTQRIDPGAWYFKAHFFQDPVQPGSLGLEALLQLLATFVLMHGGHEGLIGPRFQLLVLDEQLDWRYRGQVLPSNATVTTELEITRLEHGERGLLVVAHGCLLVDGLRIYEATGLSVRVIESDIPADAPGDDAVLVLVPPSRESLTHYWREQFAGPNPVLEDLSHALAAKFLRRVVFESTQVYEAVRAKPVMFAANHQVVMESPQFMCVMAALLGRPVNALALERHDSVSWLGHVMTHLYSFPGTTDPALMHYVIWEDKNAFLALRQEMRKTFTARKRHLLVHTAGALQASCTEPLTEVSGMTIELALDADVSVVPVRFVGGTPVEAVAEGDKLTFPVGFGSQDIYIGTPIDPGEFRSLVLAQRKALLLHRINTLGIEPEHETPNAPDPAYSASVDALITALRCYPSSAALLHLLTTIEHPSMESRALCGDRQALEAIERSSPAVHKWLRSFRAALLRDDHVRS